MAHIHNIKDIGGSHDDLGDSNHTITIQTTVKVEAQRQSFKARVLFERLLPLLAFEVHLREFPKIRDTNMVP